MKRKIELNADNTGSAMAIIPSQVRYDDNLTCDEKLLFAEITAATNSDGYCFKDDEYFSIILIKKPIEIKKMLRNLMKNYHIIIEVKRDSNGIKKRKIDALVYKIEYLRNKGEIII